MPVFGSQLSLRRVEGHFGPQPAAFRKYRDSLATKDLALGVRHPAFDHCFLCCFGFLAMPINIQGLLLILISGIILCLRVFMGCQD